MEVVEDAAMRIVHGPPGENLDFVSGTVEGRDVRKKTALRALKAFLDFASRMVVVVVANLLDAQRGHKEARCSARHMVVENGVHTQVAPRVQKGAHHSAKDTEEEKDVLSKEVVCALRVFMEGPISVWHMAVVRDALCLDAQRVLGEGLSSVSDMVEARGASLKDVTKVLKGVQTFARHMEEAKGVHGGILEPNMPTSPLVLVALLLEVRLVFVHSIAVWCMIRGSMEALL